RQALWSWVIGIWSFSRHVLRGRRAFHHSPVAVHRRDFIRLLLARRPHHLQLQVLALVRAEAEDMAAVAGGSVAAASLGEARLLAAACLDDDAGADDVGIGRPGQLDAQP